MSSRPRDFELAAGDNFPQAKAHFWHWNFLLILVNLTAAFRQGMVSVPKSPAPVSLSCDLAFATMSPSHTSDFPHEIGTFHLSRAMLWSLNSQSPVIRARKLWNSHAQQAMTTRPWRWPSRSRP